MKTKSKLSAYIPTLTKEMTSIASRTYFFCLMCVMLFAWACVAPVRGEVISVSFGGGGRSGTTPIGSMDQPRALDAKLDAFAKLLKTSRPKEA